MAETSSAASPSSDHGAAHMGGEHVSTSDSASPSATQPTSPTSPRGGGPASPRSPAAPDPFDPTSRKHATLPNFHSPAAHAPRRSRALSSPTAADSKRVRVRIPTSEMQSMGAENVRVYNLQVIVAGSVIDEVQRRYSVLLDAHKALQKAGLKRKLPKFPPKRWYADFSKSDVVEQRRTELQRYFDEVFAYPEVISCRPFLDVIRFSESTTSTLLGLAKARKQMQIQAKQHKEHQQVADYEKSQAFHLQYPQALTYGHVIDLHMSEQSLTFDSTVLGPGNYTWFRVRPTKGSFEQNLAVITNADDQPLVTIMEDRTVFSSQATFHIFFVDPRADFRTACANTNEVGKTLICTVEVQRNAFVNDDYFVKMKDGSVIQCVGDWSDRKFEFFVRGIRHPVARVRERQGTHAADMFRLQVTPGQDILMFSCIAQCLEHVHQEIVSN